MKTLFLSKIPIDHLCGDRFNYHKIENFLMPI